ncbi:MAG: phospholipase D-like domain-containing protein [Candidatus Cryptobacteroides sp.]
MQVLSVILSVFLGILILGTVIVIIFDDGDSSKKIAWILVITLLPVIGLILYFMVGINLRQSWFFKLKHRRFITIFGTRADSNVHRLLFGHTADHLVRREYKTLTRLLASDGSTCVTNGNTLEIITSGHRKFELLMEDLKNAREYIHIEYFYFRQDKGSQQIKEMLMQKAREGVKVRFIHENIANIAIRPRYYNEMKKAGVEVEKFTKPRWPLVNLFTQLNYRDHRKIVVIDGKIGYTGGMNISDDYFIRWRDTHLRITGNAVAGLQYSFLNTWITADGSIDSDFKKYFPMCREEADAGTSGDGITAEDEAEGNGIADALAKAPIQSLDMNFKLKGNDTLIQIVPDEPESRWPNIHMGAVWAVQHAKKYIYIQTPYFVPPEPMLQALQSAALSGVDVRVMVPKKADLFFMGPANRSYFTECLEAGVRIYEREGRFIHSKTFVSDDYLSEIGSANMDFRSFNLDYELNAYIYDITAAKVNKAIFLKDMEASKEVTLSDWMRRPWYKKIVQRIIRLFAALL